MFKNLFKNREHKSLKFATYCGLMIFVISSILNVLLNFADPISGGILFGILFNVGFSITIFLIIYVTMRLFAFLKKRKSKYNLNTSKKIRH